MASIETALPELQRSANDKFDETFQSVRKATPRRERLKGEAWVTDYAEDSDIGLALTPVEGGTAKVVYQIDKDYTSEMVASLPPARHGKVFHHYVKGPDDLRFRPNDTMDQVNIAERFVQLVERANVALMM